MIDRDSFQSMLEAVRAFHRRHDFAGRGGEDLNYRVTLMCEELGEIAACVTKGKPKERLAEECADLLILLLGTAISADFALDQAFWRKMEVLEGRSARIVNGRVRVSEFKDMEAHSTVRHRPGTDD